MTVKIHLVHPIDTNPEGFWKDIFLNETYNERLYREALNYKYELESWDPDKGIRKARMWPSGDAPKPIKNLLGDSFSVLDDGVYDAQKQRYEFNVISSTMPERIKTSGVLTVKDLGDGKCERIVDLTIEAKILGLGRLVESFVEATTRRDYDRSAEFANEFLAEIAS